VGCVVALHATHCLRTVCDALRIAIEERRVLLVGCCICKLRESSKMSQRRRIESEKSSSSSNYHWDGLPSPDVLCRPRKPKMWTERSAQTESGGYVGPYRDLGIPHQDTAARGRASMAARGIGDRMRGGVSADGRTVPAGVAYVTITTLSTPARV